ncbi:MAG: TIGR03086 family metal-binding protein [Ilumatobacteraceae bacterium]
MPWPPPSSRPISTAPRRAGWTVRDLLDHAASGPRFFGAIARDDLANVKPLTIDADGAWQNELATDLEALALAWRRSEAWDGETTVGDLTFPNEQWAQIGFDEAVLHAWDLAVSIGQPYEPSPDALDIIEPFIEGTASATGVEGLWGPTINTSGDTSRFERILGLSGRDPHWSSPSEAAN